MKILVTGGSGFLGSHVADELTKKGHKVEIYDIKKSRWLKKGQKFTKGNILDYKKLEKSVKRNKIIWRKSISIGTVSIKYVFGFNFITEYFFCRNNILIGLKQDK